jgi:hypothetical protein
MSKIPSAQSEFQNEETANRSAVSESLMTRMGANINYFNDEFNAVNTALSNLQYRQSMGDMYRINGALWERPNLTGQAVENEPSFIFIFNKDIEILGISFTSLATLSGQTSVEFNLGITDSTNTLFPVVNSKVFSTPLDINFYDAAATQGRAYSIIMDGGVGNNVSSKVNTLPVFNNTTLTAGKGISLIVETDTATLNNFTQIYDFNLIYKYV